MKHYRYRAVHGSGTLQTGTVQAANESDLAALLQGKGLELIDAKEQKTRFHLPENKTENTKAKILFINQMEDLLQAGIPFPDSLSLILNHFDKGQAHDKITNMERAIRSGTTITNALSKESNWFDPVSLAIIRAGEQSGQINKSFSLLSSHFQKQEEFRRTLIRSVRYPLFLLIMALCVTSFMMMWVVPQIVGFLLNQGTELPLTTRILLKAASFFELLWWEFPLCAFIVCIGTYIARHTSEKARLLTDKFFLKTPFIGKIWYQLSLARMMESMSLLLNSGLSVPDTFKTALQSLGNAYLIQIARRGHAKIMEGSAFSSCLEKLFPPFCVKRIEIGEASGRLPETILAIARNLDKDANENLKTFLSALEPALTMLVGGIMIWVVVAVLGPLYSALGPLSGGF